MSLARQPLRILYIEDSADDVLLVGAVLRRLGYDPAITQVATRAALQAALAEPGWDLILCDYNLGSFDALAALALVHASGRDLPFLIISGTIDEDQAVAALRAGAHDFITKHNLARLGPAIERGRRDARERQQRRQAEAQYRSLVESVPAIIYTAALDDSGSTTYVSPQVSALGFTPADYLADPDLWSKNIHPDDRDRVLATLDAMRTRREPYRAEYRVVDRDGRVRWLQDEAIVIRDEAGTPLFHQGVVVDITERKAAEARGQRQIDRLAALRAIDLAITSSLDLRLTLDIFLDQVVTQLGVDAVAILLHSPSESALTVAAARGFRSSSYLRARVRLGEGRAGRVALERRPLSEAGETPITATSPRTALLAGDQFHSYYGLPLIAKGQLLGVLELFHRRNLAPDPDWVEFLEALAGQAAIAIENAKLFDGLQRSNQRLMLAYDATIEGWSRALDLRDKETEGHSRRVTDLTLQLAKAVNVPEADLVHLRRGALLHDIGKMGIPDRILLKTEPLTAEEWDIMRQHPTLAYELLSPIGFLRPALDIPYCHHEKWDGTGYPRGLKGEAIPLAARLFAVVDVWDALCSERPYRPAWPRERVLAHIQALAGSHFEARIVETFLPMAP